MKTKEEKRDSWIAMGLLAGFYVLLLVVEMVVPPTHMLFSILKKSAVYSLAAVSMNLLNGFTGLFSLGQAGFMLMGAYTYAILTMPVELKMGDSVYKYYDCIVHFQTGMIPGLLMAGLVAALMAALIGIPVLRLKSDYLGIATLGFAEIIRAMFQWDALGPLTNGANILSGFLDLNHVYFPFTQVKIPPTFFVFLLSAAAAFSA